VKPPFGATNPDDVRLNCGAKILSSDNDSHLKARAKDSLAFAVAQISQKSGIDLPHIHLDFGLRGHVAGQARIINNQLEMRLNMCLLKTYTDEYLGTTIPHEVAHLCVFWQSRHLAIRPKPHGPEWQAVMQECFGLPPKRCHDYVTRPARIVSRNFLYTCRCREHRLTSIMHRKLRKNFHAFCKDCGSNLRFTRKIQAEVVTNR
jgi:SprT protein